MKTVGRKMTKKTARQGELVGAKRGRSGSRQAGAEGWWRKNKKTVYYVVFVLAWVAFAIMLSQFVVGMPMLWLLGPVKFAQPFWTMVYYILNYALAIVLVLMVPKWIGQRYKRDGFELTKEEMGVEKWPTLVDIGLVPVGYFAYLLVAGMLTKLVEILGWYDVSQAQDVGFNFLATTPERICAMVAVVFIAPIAEEVMMRGWAYGKLRSKIGWVGAMLLISVLFGVLHGQWNVGVTVTVLSLALCGLREITGSIWSGVLLHMLVNGVAFYILYIAF